MTKTKRPDAINHEQAVKAIFRRLHKKYPTLENVSQLSGKNFDFEGKIDGKPISVIVFDSEEFTRNGDLHPLSQLKIFNNSDDFSDPRKDEHRWLIFTDFQAFHQWKKIKEKTSLNDDVKRYPRGDKSSSSSNQSGGTNWFVDEKNKIKCILIPFPVISNNGWSRSTNESLTFSQILAELKFGFLKNDERLSEFYYKPRLDGQVEDSFNTISIPPTTIRELVTFFLKKRGYMKRSYKKAKNTPSTTN